MLRRIFAAAGFLGLAILAIPGIAQGQQSEYLGRPLADWASELGSNDMGVRRSAVFALGKMGKSAVSSLPQVLKILREDTEKSVREAAALAAGEIAAGSLEARNEGGLVAALAKALKDDPEPLVRRSAAIALGKLEEDAAAGQKALEQALGDQKPEVRQNAAWALGKVARAAAVPALRKALQDSDAYVLRDAANAVGLAKKEGRPALPELLQVCQHGDAEVRKAALSALVVMVKQGDKEAYGPLSKVIARPNEEMENLLNAALALGNIGGDGAKPAVRVLIEAMMQKGNPRLRAQAAAVLKNIGPAAVEALDPLRKLLGDPDPDLRRNVVVALAGFKEAGVPAFNDLIRVLANPDERPDVRAEAGVSLSRIAAPFLQEGNPPGRDNIPTLIAILRDAKAPSKVRERTLWVLANYQRELPDRKDVYDALFPIVASPRSDNNKMLRYHTAFMLGAFWRDRAPKEALDVLLEFLKDDSIKLYKETSTSGGGAGGFEKTTGEAKVKEIGEGDGRVMAIQALQRIGPGLVRPRADIMQQIKALRTSRDPKMKKALAELDQIFGE
jgi:HEAT repeat protein